MSDYGSLKRNPAAIAKLFIDNGNNEYIAGDSLKIVVPVKYEESDLMVIEGFVLTLGIFAVIHGDEFASCIVPSKMRLLPSNISKVKYQEEDFYELEFEKGQVITDNFNLVRDDTLGYYIYNYFIALGRHYWFLSVRDMLNLMKDIGEFTGKVFGQGQTIMEMIASMCVRDSNDVNQYWRQTISSSDDIYGKPFEFIALRNVSLGARNTTAKLMGSYFSDGLYSALIYPSSTSERVEELLRQ